MNDAQRLHSFARRECMARWRRWADAYEPLARAARNVVPYEYKEEAYSTFPRYNLDQAVLEAIEAFDFDSLPEAEVLRERLVQAARSAGEAPHENQVARQAIAAERQHLIEAFLGADTSALPDDRLPYRRVLNAEERSRVTRMMSETWGVSHAYWYPLDEKTHPSLIAFDLIEADRLVLQNLTAEFLSARGIARVLEIREYGPSYELEPHPKDFDYNGAEGFWTSDGADWIVYCSHESSMTFGGAIAQAIGDAGINEGLIGEPPDGRWSMEAIITAT